MEKDREVNDNAINCLYCREVVRDTTPNLAVVAMRKHVKEKHPGKSVF